jgi:hypothetical protein
MKRNAKSGLDIGLDGLDQNDFLDGLPCALLAFTWLFRVLQEFSVSPSAPEGIGLRAIRFPEAAASVFKWYHLHFEASDCRRMSIRRLLNS